MTEVETAIARGLELSKVELSPHQRRAIIHAIAAEIRDNADRVRVEMQHEVWGMVE